VRGRIVSDELQSYTNSRLVQISQAAQTLVSVSFDIAMVNSNASAISTGLHGNFATTGVDVERLRVSGTFTERIASVNIAQAAKAVQTVASASTVTLPPTGDVFSISGTTGITAINTGGWAGRTVRLIFQGVLTVTDGANLKLAGNFTTSADDVLTLACDGSAWYEVSRSAN
jgi:hypothetical protein